MYSNALSIYRPQIGPKLHLKAEIFTKIGTDIMQNYVCLVGLVGSTIHRRLPTRRLDIL